jgi:hypothetical protein
MHPKVQTVLDEYHERMKQELAIMRTLSMFFRSAAAGWN